MLRSVKAEWLAEEVSSMVNNEEVKPLRFAYADPPYPGQSYRWYRDQPTYGGEVDHAALITQLCADYPDGWALSTSAAALQSVLAMCPPRVFVAVWHRPDAEPPGNRGRWWWSWEPVIVRGGRNTRGNIPGPPIVRNVLTCPWSTGSNEQRHELAGRKPRAFCEWVLNLLGYVQGDDMVDLFPGTGIMGRVLDQTRLALWGKECECWCHQSDTVTGE
jgi:hypothetical protein